MLARQTSLVLARRTAEVAGRGLGAEKKAAQDLARTMGTSTAAARRHIATSTQLASQEMTAGAVRTGQVSAEQATAIAEVCDIDPTAQADLISRAGEQTLHDLKRTCRDRHSQTDPDRETRRRRHHQQRRCTTMIETDGEWKAFLSAPADMGARFEAALRADHDVVFRDAHAAGRRDPDGAYRLDALLNVMERGAATRPASTTATAPAATAVATGGGAGGGTGSVAPGGSPVLRTGRQQTVIVNVDLAALHRGRVTAGETCRIEGVGEVALAAVKALIPAAHIPYVIRDGVNVRSVTHLGRQATAHQRTALNARGYACEVPHCRASHLLEIDGAPAREAASLSKGCQRRRLVRTLIGPFPPAASCVARRCHTIRAVPGRPVRFCSASASHRPLIATLLLAVTTGGAVDGGLAGDSHPPAPLDRDDDRLCPVSPTGLWLVEVSGDPMVTYEAGVDVLTGGAHMALAGGPVLLTQPMSMSAPAADYACGRRVPMFAYGGTDALSDAVLDIFEGVVAGTSC